MNVIEKILTTKGYSNIKVINEMKKALKELENFSIDFSDKNIVHTYDRLIKETLAKITKDVPFTIIPLDCTLDGTYVAGAIHDNNYRITSADIGRIYPIHDAPTHWTTSPVDSASLTIDSGSLYITGTHIQEGTIRGVRANGIYTTDFGPDSPPITIDQLNNR